RADGDAGGADRPLRPAARADAGAARLPSAAHRRRAPGCGQDRFGARAHAAAVRTEAGFRSREADRADPEGRAASPRRPEPRAHRARRAKPGRARGAGARVSRSVVLGGCPTRAPRPATTPSLMSPAASMLPPQVRVFVRDWLSSNNVLLKSHD